MKIEALHDVFFVLGVAGIGWGVYDLFGAGWASITVGLILLSISIYGSRET